MGIEDTPLELGAESLASHIAMCLLNSLFAVSSSCTLARCKSLIWLRSDICAARPHTLYISTPNAHGKKNFVSFLFSTQVSSSSYLFAKFIAQRANSYVVSALHFPYLLLEPQLVVRQLGVLHKYLAVREREMIQFFPESGYGRLGGLVLLLELFNSRSQLKLKLTFVIYCYSDFVAHSRSNNTSHRFAFFVED